MRAPVVLALIAAALFGAATPFSKLLLSGANPFLLAGLLYLGAALALAPSAFRNGFLARVAKLGRRNRRYLAASAFFGGFLGPVCLLFGLRLAKSASVSLWLNLELVATAALGHLLFKDRMTKASAIATTGVLAASFLLSFEGDAGGAAGGLFVAAACLAWALDNHATALMDGLGPAESTFIKGLVAGSTNLAIGLSLSSLELPRIGTLAAAFLVGALSYGASISLYISAAHGLGASRAQLYFSASPLFGIALAAFLLGESFSLLQGAALALMGLSWILLAFERHGHAHEHAAFVHTHWHQHGDAHHDHGHEGLDALGRLLGHSHEHAHEARVHGHPHVSDIHHRHAHAAET